MPYTLLVFDLDIEVAHHDDSSLGPNTLFATGKLARLHVTLKDVDTILLVKRDARYLIETDDVVLTYQATLSICIVDEHLRHSGLAT